jgi:hypothetical protein
MAEPINLGDDVVLHAEFRTKVGGVDTLTDPTGNTCTFKVNDPTGVETTISGGSVTRLSTGIYEATFTPTVEGEHWYKAVGTGAAKGVGQSVFPVDKQRVP